MIDTKYGRLVDAIKEGIASGKYGEGAPLPSVRAMIRRYHVSDRTVQHALDELERQRLIVRRQGSGTFVSRAAAQRKVGLIVPGTAYSEFFSRIVCEVLRLAQKEEMTLLFGDIASERPDVRARTAKRIAADFVRQGVSGVLYQPLEFMRNSESINREIVALFAEASVPVVLVDCDIVKPPKRSEFDLVSVNNEASAGQLAELVAANGARKIHFLMHADHSPNMYRRVNGVRNVVSALGLPWSPSHVMEISPDDSRAVARHLKKHRPDAVICGTDMVAASFCHTLTALGVRVPDDILVAGFDDMRTATVMSPPLTTVHQPCEQIAEKAFYGLLDRMADPSRPPLEIFLPAPLVERASTRRSPSVEPLAHVKQRKKGAK